MTALAETPRSAQVRVVDRLSTLPWWLIFILLVGVFLSFQFSTNLTYQEIFGTIINGLVTTVYITLTAYLIAVVLGLIAGLGRVSKNIVIFNLATLYVQVIRGVPMLVQIFYWAFVMVPGIIGLLHLVGNTLAPWLGAQNALTELSTQSIDNRERIILALAFAYGGFEAETFRAGIESIGKGQMEAARSLGMSYPQAMIHVILPQAIRRVLPPLGNDFISMLKDSSFGSVLGVREITQQARLYAASTFLFPETYNSLAFTYLALTLILSLVVRFVETCWKQL